MPGPIIDPFTADGFTMIHLTRGINVFPVQYGRLAELGLFTPVPIATRSVAVERFDGKLHLLPTRTPGASGSSGVAEKRILRNFTVPHIPHDDALMPQDYQGIRAFDTQDSTPAAAQILARKLMAMRQKHDITKEHLRWGALDGIIRDADGSVIVNLFTEFEVSQHVIDFDLGNAATDVGQKCRDLSRYYDQNLKGEVMSGIHVFVDKSFFDKLIKHDSIKDAYKFYSSVSEPLREDTRKRFPHQGVVFEEHLGEAQDLLEDGTTITRKFLATDDAVAIPLGTLNVFEEYNAPADFNETANTLGLPQYAKVVPAKFDRGWDLHTQSNPLPMCKRPDLLVRAHTSS